MSQMDLSKLLDTLISLMKEALEDIQPPFLSNISNLTLVCQSHWPLSIINQLGWLKACLPAILSFHKLLACTHNSIDQCIVYIKCFFLDGGSMQITDT